MSPRETTRSEVDSLFSFKDKTFISRDQEFATELGDSKEPSIFLPHIKISRWDNEANSSIRLFSLDFATAFTDAKADRVEWKTPGVECHFYDLGGLGEGGGMEMEVWLLTRPASPRIAFTIQTKGLEFIHQPYEKSGDVDGEIVNQPEDIADSYAVYFGKQHNKYGTGKSHHIKRAWARDANGKQVWCKYEMRAGMMYLYLPTDFYNTAVYPVLVDPTFGYTTIGGTSVSSVLNQTKACKFTLANGNAMVSKISVYGAASAGTINVDGHIYIDNGSGYPGARRGTIAPGVSYSTSAAWRDLPFTSEFLISPAGTYWIGFNNSASSLVNYYDTGSTNQRYFVNDTYGSEADPYPAGGTGSDRIQSFYATYKALLAGRPMVVGQAVNRAANF